jgi:hypothetical protein
VDDDNTGSTITGGIFNAVIQGPNIFHGQVTQGRDFGTLNLTSPALAEHAQTTPPSADDPPGAG